MKKQMNVKMPESLISEMLEKYSRKEINSIMAAAIEAFVSGTISYEEDPESEYSFYLESEPVQKFRNFCKENGFVQNEVVPQLWSKILSGEFQIENKISVKDK